MTWTPPDARELDALIDGYEVQSLLGSGAMGAVYKAVQISLQRPVAIKVLPSELASEVGFAERFQLEAEALAQLRHPGIVTVHDSGHSREGHAYIVMELVEGVDLRDRIESGKLMTGEETRVFFADVCEALHHAHEKGFLHRDIKPGNLLLDPDGAARITDFGLAKIVQEEHPAQDSQLTLSGFTMGTAAYAPPELLMKGEVVDHRVDLFSLGVTLYECLTGEVPRGAFPPPSEVRPELGTAFDDLITKAMRPRADDRYADAMEFKDALLPESKSEPVEAIPVAESKGRKSLALPIVLGGLLLLSGLAAMGLRHFKGGRGEQEFSLVGMSLEEFQSHFDAINFSGAHHEMEPEGLSLKRTGPKWAAVEVRSRKLTDASKGLRAEWTVSYPVFDRSPQGVKIEKLYSMDFALLAKDPARLDPSSYSDNHHTIIPSVHFHMIVPSDGRIEPWVIVKNGTATGVHAEKRKGKVLFDPYDPTHQVPLFPPRPWKVWLEIDPEKGVAAGVDSVLVHRASWEELAFPDEQKARLLGEVWGFHQGMNMVANGGRHYLTNFRMGPLQD